MPPIPPPCWFVWQPVEFEIDIEFQEWVIPFVKIVCYFSTYEEWLNIEPNPVPYASDVYFENWEMYYFFKKVRNKDIYKLFGRINASLEYREKTPSELITNHLPLFINLHVYVFNERLNCELQTKKT